MLVISRTGSLRDCRKSCYREHGEAPVSKSTWAFDVHLYSIGRCGIATLLEFIKQIFAPSRGFMNADLTEEEMRRALFGTAEPERQVPAAPVRDPVPEVVFNWPAAAPVAKKKVAKTFTPRLRVTLQVGNEFEGKTYELIHEADTLSSLLAEQEAVKAARKKYKYVEVVSVKSM